MLLLTRPLIVLSCIVFGASACAPDPAAGEAGPDVISASTTGSSQSEADTLASEDGETDPGTSIAMASSGWLTVSADGAVQTTYLDADGRYRDYRDGEPIAEGKWRRGGRSTLCFEQEDTNETCWDIGTMDSAQSAIASDAEGKTIRITRVDYDAPDAVSDSASDNGAR